MPNDVFFDTNILIYLTSNDATRVSISDGLVRAGGIISVQVLNEAARITTGKLKFDWAEVAVFLTGIRSKCQVVPLTTLTHERGLAYAERYQVHVYDAMIIAAAVLAGCSTLWSEDMHDGLVIDGLTIRNPYV